MSPLPFGSKTTADQVLAGIDLQGRTALVTGANIGIGYETARALSHAGARVIFACRNPQRGKDAVMRSNADEPRGRGELMNLDLGQLSAVAESVRALDLERLDMLVCNAGIYPGAYRQTADGFEETVGVCHIGHFLLFLLLLPALEQSDDARVVMVSSESHRMPRTLDFDRLPLTQKDYGQNIAYGQAKLCNVLMANEIERRFGEPGASGAAAIHGYSLHPGTLVTTGIGRNSLLARVAVQLSRPFTKTAAQGAATSVMCAAHPELREGGGRYYVNCQPGRASREGNHPEVAARLWERSREWVADYLR
ncbi:MAG: SDR family NAD(P)-dependent oxidoreductase [Myxococcales bacterium]|nr:SDR family NAD(P)-dependent oxidoreductase [Myxococcales bacterium]